MAEQEEPLYDFPEPSQTLKFKGHQRSRGSLRSISVLDRLLLTVPVWLQLSINPATALHILQREPPGTFMVRNSRTSHKKVLCVRLADNSEPSFVQQFDIQEEHSTFSLVTSAVNFPDLPRLVSFYCSSRDVLPFPLELPEAIARATSHKELESISHMGIEFWNSHLNVRGPREAPKPEKDPAPAASNPPTPPPTPPPEVQPKQDHQTAPARQPATPPAPPPVRGDANAALFKEFCPIKTRSPKELNYGSGIGALCFINPLFLQSLNAWSRRGRLKRSLKVRVSTESSTLLLPPLVSPPPPPLMPKAKGRCKARDKGTKAAESINDTGGYNRRAGEEDYTELPSRTRKELIDVIEHVLPLPAITESLVEDEDYTRPTVNAPHPLTPYLSPKLPKKSTSRSPRNSPSSTPSVSPYQSPLPSPKTLSPFLPFSSTCSSPRVEDAYDIPVPYSDRVQTPEAMGDVDELEEVLENELVRQINAESLSDKESSSLSSREEVREESQEDEDYTRPTVNAPHPLTQYLSPKLPKKSTSLSPRNSPSSTPSVSPYQSPSPSPKTLSPFLPFSSTCSSPRAEDAYDIPVPYSDRVQTPEAKGDPENELVRQINAASLSDKESSSLSSREEAPEGQEEARGEGQEEARGEGQEEARGEGQEEALL